MKMTGESKYLTHHLRIFHALDWRIQQNPLFNDAIENLFFTHKTGATLSLVTLQL